ncbi:MAG TPA: hypothetical protein VJS44_12925 [Pyrinomonadaceae bacterium]|nr:hypothetical protein [Pyrinomonadaceae bacterium]
MTIRANIIRVKGQILADVVSDNKAFSEGVKNKAIDAVLKGQGSPEWRTYMEMFVDPGREDQLARLMGTDDTASDPDMNHARAYLVADGPCGTGTVLNFGNFASFLLDAGLPDTP